MNKDCIQYCSEYVKQKSIELEGCSEYYKMEEAVFSTFLHLSIYFPEAYQHMLKVWGVLDEDN